MVPRTIYGIVTISPYEIDGIFVVDAVYREGEASSSHNVICRIKKHVKINNTPKILDTILLSLLILFLFYF